MAKIIQPYVLTGSTTLAEVLVAVDRLYSATYNEFVSYRLAGMDDAVYFNRVSGMVQAYSIITGLERPTIWGMLSQSYSARAGSRIPT